MVFFLVVYPFFGALLSYGIGKKNKAARDIFAEFITVTECLVLGYFFCNYQVGVTKDLTFEWNNFSGLGLHFRMDGFRLLYGLIAAIMWMMTTIFSKEYFKLYKNKNRYYAFTLMTLGATMGVFLSDDLFTTFLFFEIMSFTSYVWVAHDEKKESLRAAQTYLAVAVLGGLVMLMGIFLLYNAIGTLTFSDLLIKCKAYGNQKLLFTVGLCMLFGFGAKAGAFPLHIWLPKAHPVAPAPASALLSGILTKTGIFGILVVSCNLFLLDETWGTLLLILGVLTMTGGAVLALLSIDLKRTLACSSMSQIGFILIGVGMQCLLGEENALAAKGTLLHMVNHSFLKLVLFLFAGVVVMNIHKRNLNDIKGFGHNKPLLHFIFLVGAIGISGIPGGNGYISKTLIHESIIEYIVRLQEGQIQEVVMGIWGMKLVEFFFIISGGITIAYMLKLYIAIFIEYNVNDKLQEKFVGMKHCYMGKQSSFTLLSSSILIVSFGIFPYVTMDRLSVMGMNFMHAGRLEQQVHYFSSANLSGAFYSIIVGISLYLLVVRHFLMRQDPSTKRETKREYYIKKEYRNIWPEKWDLEDQVYRPIFLTILPIGFGSICRIGDCLLDYAIVGLRKTVFRDSKIPHELEEGTPVTHVIGSFMDKIVTIMNKTVRRKKPIKVSYEHKLAILNDEISESNTIIGRSLSFGLMMFCIGLLLTLAYLLIY